MPQYLLGETALSEAQLRNKAMENNMSLEELLEINPDIKLEEDPYQHVSSSFMLGDTELSYDQLDKKAKDNNMTLQELLDINPDIKRNTGLPQVSKEIMEIGEKQALPRLRKMFGGLGWDFKETEGFMGAGWDRITAIAPPDKDGVRKEMVFGFDKDIGIPALKFLGGPKLKGEHGFLESGKWSFGLGSKKEVEKFNAFIRENTNSDYINEQTYSRVWNYANNKKSFDELEKLSSKELQQFVNDTYAELMYSGEKLPGVNRVFKELNSELESFARQTTQELSKKYDFNDPTQRDKATEEFNAIMDKEEVRIVKDSKELDNIHNAVVSALSSRFNTDVTDKLRTEAENLVLPNWIFKLEDVIGKTDYVRQGWITHKLKHPKSWQETQILHRGQEIKNTRELIEKLKTLDPNEKYIDPEWDFYDDDEEGEGGPADYAGFGKDPMAVFVSKKVTEKKKIEGKPRPKAKEGDVTNAEQIKNLENRIADLNKFLVGDFISQSDYQRKLEATQVPSAFGKTISDPDLTLDEWQGMLGDQTVQMISSIFVAPVYIQEAGGIAFESIELEAAKKSFPHKGEWTSADYEKALRAFRELPEEDGVDMFGNQQMGRRSLMLDILNKGEVNLTPAFTGGVINAGLDFAGTFVGFTKLLKFAPISLGRNLLARDMGGILKTMKPLAVATAVEVPTELAQEFTSIKGVGLSTGYYGNREANLKRYGEAFAQAALSTGPLVGMGGGGRTALNDARANWRAKNDPDHTRNVINDWKSIFDNAYKDGDLTLGERNELFDELEAEENVINMYEEYFEMTAGQKQDVVINSMEINKGLRSIKELQEKIKELKKDAVGGLSTEALKLQSWIKKYTDKIRDHQRQIDAQRRLKDDQKTRKFFVQHVLENPHLYNNITPTDFTTVEQARKYFEEMGLLGEEGVQRLMAGKVNAFYLKGTGQLFSIKAIREKNIKNNYGWGTSNAFHHDILHGIQENMTIQEMRTMWDAISKELDATEDPALKQIWETAKLTYEQRYGDKGFTKAHRDYYMEQMANLSDALKEYRLSQLTERSGTSFTNIGNYLGGFFGGKTKVGKKWTEFGPENALEHIKEYTNFYGQRSSLKIPPLPKGKVEVDKEEKIKVKKEEKVKVKKEKPKYADGTVGVKREVFKITQSDGQVFYVRGTKRLDGSLGNIGTSKDGKTFRPLPLGTKGAKNLREALDVYEKDGSKVELIKEEGYKEVQNKKLWDRLTQDQKERVDPKRAKEGAKKSQVLESVTVYDDQTIFTPENLVQIIKSPSSKATEKAGAEAALVKQFDLLALKALRYDTRKGDIARENVIAEARKYFPGIIERFNPKDAKFSTFVTSNIGPKQAVIYENAKSLTYGETVSLDTKEAREVVGEPIETTTPKTETRAPKINILSFATVSKVIDKIKALVKVILGDTFKDIILRYAGKVGELIFNIPAKKIMEGGANLTAVTKYEEGMPAPAEAQNIQKFFNAEQNAERFIKTLPLYNVTDKTADIDKVGENIDVSRNVYGIAIGLKGLPLDYFYEPFTDPKALSKDPKIKKEAITSPGGRSLGLTTQTPVKRLRSKFRNPTPEVIEKFKQDIGITPKGQENVYSRDIGQLLKGVARVYSINAAISAAQRFQEAKLKKAPAEQKKAIKQQTADITAAQSKAAFSEIISEKSEQAVRNMASQLIIDNTNFTVEGAVGKNKLDGLLTHYGQDTAIRIDKKADIGIYIQNLKDHVFPLLPKEAWFGPRKGTVFTTSHKNLGFKKSSDPLWKSFVNQIQALKNDNTIKYGKPIPGVDAKKMYSLRNQLGKLFTNPETIKANIKNGKIDIFNDQVGKIHKALWKRIYDAISKDKTNTKGTGIASYLKLVANDRSHWHKLGAQFFAYSKKPVGTVSKKTGKRTLYELEHAMPATSAYLYLLDVALIGANFDAAYKAIVGNYKLIALDANENTKLNDAGLARNMTNGWNLIDNIWHERYFNELVAAIEGGINPNSIIGLDGKTLGKTFNINAEGKARPLKIGISKTKKLDTAIQTARTNMYSEVSKGITVLDFDDTLATTKSLVRYTAPDGTKGALNAEQYAIQYQDLLAQGYIFDFTEFDKVVKAKLAPLFNKALKLQKKFGSKNMFILTARPLAAQKAIRDFLKANGLNIPIKNIATLGNSTAEAKALWVAEKVGEGYNDFYFADDALQNVQAVKNTLNQFDVKSKVQQARVLFAETMSDAFNDILEDITGIESKKRFSAIKARKRGASKGRFRLFIPPSHEDFVGILYNFIGKGRKGDAHRDFFEQALVRPLNRAYRELNTAKQAIANDYKSLNKEFKNVRKKFTKKTPDGDFTIQDAIRVYLFDKHGHKVPGLSETDQQKLVDLVMSDAELQVYAEALNVISKQDTYVSPTESWVVGDIRTDLDAATGRVGREQFFTEFWENANVIFSEENLNKIEAAFGEEMRSAIEDILHRTRTGSNRPSGKNKMVNIFLNYLNGSIAATMFFNTRSMVLQQMSMVNFINFADNNIYAAAKAFFNYKQYWTDWAFIFNSDFMKQRRRGIQTDVNGAELAASLKGAKNTPRALLAKLLELGFLPTQIGDNNAIATGGATFYRNRINTYLKQGLSQKEAQEKAWIDFQILAEATQQSARPDMVSQQQASILGWVILAFQNVTSQFNRLGKKAFLDIKNRRITPGNTTQFQSDISNLSRIAYYFAIQNLIFYSLQSALFMALFDDNEDDERWLKKKERVINGSIDSVLRGTGVWGAVIATLKNMAIKWHEQREKGYNADESAVLMEMLNVSPPLGIKARKMVNAEKTLNYNRKVIDEMETFDIDNPMWSAVTNYIEATTNAPTNRMYNKAQNTRQSLNSQHEDLERVLMFGGWSQWNLGIENEKVEKAKKKQKFGTRKRTRTRTRTRSRTR